MKHYEMLYIIPSRYAENEIAKISENIDEIIKKHGGSITYTKVWERKKLAYPINHINNGYYVVSEFDLEPEKNKLLDRDVKITPEILRHMIVVKDTIGQPPLPTPVEARVKEEVVEEIKAEKPKTTDVPKIEVTEPETVISENKKEEKAVEKKSDDKEIAEEIVTEKKADKKVKKDKSSEDEDKKKDKKVSLQDLDKKLDEILNNDLI